MHKVRFLSFKLADQFDIEVITSFFNFTRTIRWQQFLMLDNEIIETVLKRSIENHTVYIYSFGVITFVDFYEDEIRTFIRFLENIVPINEQYFLKYMDHYEVMVGEYGEGYLFKEDESSVMTFKEMMPLVAESIAKSVGLQVMEDELIELMDEVEPLIYQMHKGRLKINPKTLKILGRIISFKYQLAQNIDVYNKPEDARTHRIINDAFVGLNDYFELYDRYRIIDEKNQDLRQIVLRYYDFNVNRKERQLYILEVFLLFLFPLSSLIDHVPFKAFVESVLNRFF